MLGLKSTLFSAVHFQKRNNFKCNLWWWCNCNSMRRMPFFLIYWIRENKRRSIMHFSWVVASFESEMRIKPLSGFCETKTGWLFSHLEISQLNHIENVLHFVRSQLVLPSANIYVTKFTRVGPWKFMLSSCSNIVYWVRCHAGVRLSTVC